MSLLETILRIATRGGRDGLERWKAAGRPDPPWLSPHGWFGFLDLFRNPRPYSACRETDAAFWDELRARTAVDRLTPAEARDRVDALIGDGTLVVARRRPAIEFPLPPAFASFNERHGDVSSPAAGLHVGPGVATAAADGRWIYVGGDADGLVVAIDPSGEAADTVYVTDGLADRPYEPIAVAPTVEHFLLLAAAARTEACPS